MAASKKLAKFTVLEAGESFNLHIEDEAGDVLELSATRDQVDVIADTLADLLEDDDDAEKAFGHPLAGAQRLAVRSARLRLLRLDLVPCPELVGQHEILRLHGLFPGLE